MKQNSKKTYLTELNLGVECNIGAPIPTVLADEHNLYLLYYTKGEQRNNDGGRTVHKRAASDKDEVAVIHFRRIYIFKFGGLDEEVFGRHQYAKLGLEPYKVFEVMNSDWIEEEREQRGDESKYYHEYFNSLRHYIFFFHDTNLECIAQNFTIKVVKTTMSKLVQEVATKLNL